jgi:hypothetical protein
VQPHPREQSLVLAESLFEMSNPTTSHSASRKRRGGLAFALRAIADAAERPQRVSLAKPCLLLRASQLMPRIASARRLVKHESIEPKELDHR